MYRATSSYYGTALIFEKKHDTLKQRQLNVASPSTELTQHENTIG